jgi:hypothetical protein
MKRTIGLLLACMMACMMAVMLVLSGCTGKPAGTPASPSPLTPAEVLSKSYDAMQAVKSFHFVLDHKTGGTPIAAGIDMQKAEGDIANPDKFQTKITGTLMGSAIEVSIVTVGDTSMMTNPLSNKWEVIPDSFKVLTVFDPGSGIASIIKGLSDLSDLGDTSVGGKNCYHLKGNIASEALQPLTGTTATGVPIAAEVWIDKETMLVQQVQLTGKITDSEAGGIVRTLQFSDYDKEVAIALPQQ